MVVRLIVFLIAANLICRSTDISKCFIESLGVRDNESRLYMGTQYNRLTVIPVGVFVQKSQPCPKLLPQLLFYLCFIGADPKGVRGAQSNPPWTHKFWKP